MWSERGTSWGNRSVFGRRTWSFRRPLGMPGESDMLASFARSWQGVVVPFVRARAASSTTMHYALIFAAPAIRYSFHFYEKKKRDDSSILLLDELVTDLVGEQMLARSQYCPRHETRTAASGNHVERESCRLGLGFSFDLGNGINVTCRSDDLLPGLAR